MPEQERVSAEKRRPGGSREAPAQVDHFIDTFLATTCEKSRRLILQLLAPPNEAEAGDFVERRPGEIAQILGLSKATVSEHLRQLLSLHLVVARKQGTETYYRLSNHELVDAFQSLLQALHNHYH